MNRPASRPLLFLRQTLQSPGLTGAVAASSPRLADIMIENARLHDAASVVEIGPGTGVFTGRILQAISPSASFCCIEINPAFADETRHRYPTARVHTGSAEDIGRFLTEDGRASCDRIVSGLPWTAFDPALQIRLLDALYAALEPGGLLLTFAYFPLHLLPRGRRFRDLLRRKFRTVRRTQVVANLPPAFFYVCQK